MEAHLVNSNVKAYKCDVEGCDKSFASARNMSTHKRTVHEGVYHECSECGKRFGKKGNMRRHYKDVHGEEKHYKCAKCGLQFSQNSDTSESRTCIVLLLELLRL